MSLAVIILAAGEGTRMKSSYPKVLHNICEKPMIHHVLETVNKLGPERIVAVVGHKAEMVVKAIEGVEFVVQKEQLGTGHAVSVVEGVLDSFNGDIMVLSGDTPLLKAQTLSNLLNVHRTTGAASTLLTAKMNDPTGYGRIIRAPSGVVTAIIEEKDATTEQKLINEVNTGTYCFDKKKLFDSLRQIDPNNKQKEYYLTDVIKILSSSNEKVVAASANDPMETIGINNRVQLAEAEKILRQEINKKLMLEGVTIIDPDTTFISAEAKIGKDTIIYPMTFISGNTKIGESCLIGPLSRLINCKIGSFVTIDSAVVRESTVEDYAELGPFCHIRPGTLIRKGAKVGGFVEIKKSEVGQNSKVPHLSYIGDTYIGDYVNIGAGTITCNYDSISKHKTVIEDGAFIGSDTMLVAPVKIGRGAFTGAGSVISKDVPEDSLAVERTEQVIVDNWAKKRRRKKGISEG
ncbi:MAG: bifunctional UDP-N-acetylglucosamine diphosphorylase/glucosamine-1-phosphate N-acetyltransferase GlmU [Actinomycetota bacterium]|nr:bifunctional UDP-N-acetylglucosamine diphosphorylase/glucosamine-1-phosphate N-acetyltransferase GlmU [Actinomycetota bacterium]